MLLLLTLKHQTMDKVQKGHDFKCGTPLSEYYRSGIRVLFIVAVHFYNPTKPPGHISDSDIV